MGPLLSYARGGIVEVEKARKEVFSPPKEALWLSAARKRDKAAATTAASEEHCAKATRKEGAVLAGAQQQRTIARPS